MKNLITIDQAKLTNAKIDNFIEIISNNEIPIKEILNIYLNKFTIFAIDLDTLELVAGFTFDKKSYINEDYYKRFDNIEFIDLSLNPLYMEYQYICICNNVKLWGKFIEDLGGGHSINWNNYPLWGTRKAKILELLR